MIDLVTDSRKIKKGDTFIALRGVDNDGHKYIESAIKKAEILSITNRQYGRYERGERDMPIDLLRILAKYYTVSIDYLVEDTDISKRYPPPKKTSKV